MYAVKMDSSTNDPHSAYLMSLENASAVASKISETGMAIAKSPEKLPITGILDN
ncbi:hypothetical protein QTN47_21090 [Danxiaibacter flavus]|uniref:Uncharacterized protein n=1 Tax=Danxiaibacter flavus TaxID=3049108 RepID=A0ABV3ZN75_9BACT|nr:hypothetical protein QNM32_21095 [Chitinophagaceae bacterium DXS]